ncbi:MAG: hypothetical protein EBT03_09885 [Betaproteobacteria bacterium]|nr:hypothetical protein [Betaproteobacteria bacterium]
MSHYVGLGSFDVLVVVLLGVHCQREFEAQVAPVLRARGEGWVRRVGLPHPTLKTCGYFTLKELGPLDEKILPLDRPLQTFSPHRGW